MMSPRAVLSKAEDALCVPQLQLLISAKSLAKPGRENWLHDENATRCKACSSEFSALLRKHHCRACGDIFCWKCSSQEVCYTPRTRKCETDYYEKPKRVCEACFRALSASPPANIRITITDLRRRKSAEGKAIIGGAGLRAQAFRSLDMDASAAGNTFAAAAFDLPGAGGDQARHAQQTGGQGQPLREVRTRGRRRGAGRLPEGPVEEKA